MNSTLRSNPFFELYVGERVTDDEFVRIFSPVLVRHSEALFTQGNVVITGVQGSGKSMLLGLLKTDVRLAYHRSRQEFPVVPSLQGFLGAGINLAHSNAIDFGMRRMPRLKREEEEQATALYFGDFVNYGICLDVIRSLEKLGSNAALTKLLGIDLSEDTTGAFIDALGKESVWYGYLKGVSDFPSLKKRLADRLQVYRDYLHYNSSDVGGEIEHSKTAIGVPVSTLIRLLKRASIVKPNTHLFVYIDQYEELANLKRANAAQVDDFRKLINKALAQRDPNVSYRIGARSHAWTQGTEIFGSIGRVEEERDYKLIDLDALLRRPENRKTWVFPAFAADVFGRRLTYAGVSGLSPGDPTQRLLSYVFGPGVEPAKRGIDYAGSNPQRAVKTDESWPAKVRKCLSDLSNTDPLSARLGEAWYLQRSGRADFSIDEFCERPWDKARAQWWRKERIEQALFQIAGRCQQRIIWTGANEIVELSGGNILIFISLCQHIWSTRLRLANRAAEDLSSIDDNVQALGISQASTHWVRKITEGTGHSGDRARFVRWLAEYIGAALSKDRALSYPGHNGFSVALDELEAKPHVCAFLSELADYGNLFEGPHVTKEKDRKTRLKWYLNPVYCPHFRIPYKRLKEPQYVSVNDIEKWLQHARVSSTGELHGSLFEWASHRGAAVQKRSRGLAE